MENHTYIHTEHIREHFSDIVLLNFVWLFLGTHSTCLSLGKTIIIYYITVAL